MSFIEHSLVIVANPYRSQLVAGFSPKSSSRVVCVGFVVDTLAVGLAFVQAPHFSPVKYYFASDPFLSVIRGWFSGLICSLSTKGLNITPLQK
jgi:hypothetical protein